MECIAVKHQMVNTWMQQRASSPKNNKCNLLPSPLPLYTPNLDFDFCTPTLILLPMASSAFHLLLSTLAIITAPAIATSRGVTLAKQQNSSADEFLTAHNQARSEVGVAPLKWSKTLASNASLLVRYQRDKSQCGFADLSSSNYGANQATASFTPGPAEVVGSWVGEKAWYSHANNSCATGHQCGTYTQVVWRKTLEVGCAQAVCSSGSSLTICLYNPHGNVQGEIPY